MTHKMKAGAAVVALLLVAGCSRSMPEMGRDTGPAPLPPAPAGRVSADQLPPPPPPPPPGASTNASADFNASAGADGDATANAGGNTQVASTSSEPLSRTSMTGFYQVSASGGNCRVGLTLTQYDENYNAASMGCPGRLADVRRWSTTGNQLQLKDTSANVIATLTSSGKNRFTGQTTTGVPVELYR